AAPLRDDVGARVDGVQSLPGEPDIAVIRASRDSRSANPIKGDGELAVGRSGRVDLADLVGSWLREPEVAVRSRRDICGTASDGGEGELADGVCGRVDLADLVGAQL